MQNNVRQGLFPAVAAEDLSAMADRIVEITHADGALRVQLPTSDDSRALALLVEGAAAGSDCLCLPLNSDQQIRVTAKGAGNPGDSLCLADVATPADAGMLRALPEAADTYRVFAICEEEFADGGLLLARPNGPEAITVN